MSDEAGFVKVPGLGDRNPGMRLSPSGSRLRLGNADVRSIPVADRLLSVRCAAGGSHKRPRLVAVVDRQRRLTFTNTPDAQVDATTVFAPCRCAHDGNPARRDSSQRGHLIDLGKMWAVVERLQFQHAKARVVDVSRLRPG